MVRLSKKIRDFLTETNKGVSKRIAKMPNGAASYILPGDIFIFRYHIPANKDTQGSNQQRAALVVRNRRTTDGVFLSTRNNLLVSCFKLDGEPEVIVDTIVENLYKKRRRSSYWGKISQSLVKILGKNSYRTYKLDQMKGMYKVYYKGLLGSRR